VTRSRSARREGDDRRRRGAEAPWPGDAAPPWLPEEFDAIDRQIFERLRLDGRAPNQRIAAALGLSEATVRRRVKAMVDSGLLKITAVVPATAYENALMGQVDVKLVGDLREAAALVSSWREVTWLAIAAGGASFLLEFVCLGREEFLDFVQRLHAVQGVSRCEIFMYVKTIKQIYVGPVLNSPAAPEPASTPAAAARPRTP
jgi:Lrp/AsnC family transcriptional regulator for asnA, asnC and gidA